MISETCYRYLPKLSDENVEIADRLIGLAHHQRDWSFGANDVNIGSLAI